MGSEGSGLRLSSIAVLTGQAGQTEYQTELMQLGLPLQQRNRVQQHAHRVGRAVYIRLYSV